MCLNYREVWDFIIICEVRLERKACWSLSAGGRQTKKKKNDFVTGDVIPCRWAIEIKEYYISYQTNKCVTVTFINNKYMDI